MWLFWLCLGAIELIAIPFCVLYTVYTDAWLSSYSHFSVIVYYLLFYCVLANLSAAMTLRKKESAKDKPPELLCDLDVDYDEVRVKFESVRDLDCSWKERLRISWNNFIRFCKCHSSYGLVAALGSGFIVAAIILFITNLPRENSSLDLLCSALILAVFGSILLIAVFRKVGSPNVYSRRKESYRPFDEKAKIPLKVFGAKILAAYLTGDFMNIVQLPTGLYFFIGGFRALYFMPEIPKDDSLQLNYRLPEGTIYSIFQVIMTVVIYVGMFLIYRAASMTYARVKQSFLVNMELNWQRNLHAMQYIIPRDVQNNAQQSSLEGVRSRLEAKGARVTPQEWSVYFYISLPLWKPKRAYCEKQIICRREKPKRPFGDKFELRGDPPPEEHVHQEQ